MASSLLDSLTALITPQNVSGAASQLGESPANVTRGLTASVGAILAGLAGKAGDSGLLNQVFQLATDRNVSTASQDLPGLLRSAPAGGSLIGDLGGKLLSTIFGGQTSTVSDAISRTSGMKTSSISSLLSMAASLVLGLISRKVRDEGLTASGLGGLLQREKDSLLAAAPAGLPGVLGSIGVPRAPAVTSPGRPSWLLPILGLIAVAAAIWFLGRGCREREAVPAVSTPAPVETAAVPVSDFVKRTLPTGVELSFRPTGIEGNLISFIEDGSRPVDETTWFDFDRLLFETGSAVLKPESQEQLHNVAEILKAFPNVEVKVGGYTDNVGDPASNLKLSGERAQNVRAELVKLGIAESRLAAEGYGEQHPVADNTTEEGRAQNRRISLRVTKK